MTNTLAYRCPTAAIEKEKVLYHLHFMVTLNFNLNNLIQKTFHEKN